MQKVRCVCCCDITHFIPAPRVAIKLTFDVQQITRLTMSDVLKLYVAAYQLPSMWKQLWKNIHPYMSTQISKDIELFVKNNPFATENFLHILKTSSPF
jgi:hypothetical protein